MVVGSLEVFILSLSVLIYICRRTRSALMACILVCFMVSSIGVFLMLLSPDLLLEILHVSYIKQDNWSKTGWILNLPFQQLGEWIFTYANLSQSTQSHNMRKYYLPGLLVAGIICILVPQWTFELQGHYDRYYAAFSYFNLVNLICYGIALFKIWYMVKKAQILQKEVGS